MHQITQHYSIPDSALDMRSTLKRSDPQEHYLDTIMQIHGSPDFTPIRTSCAASLRRYRPTTAFERSRLVAIELVLQTLKGLILPSSLVCINPFFWQFLVKFCVHRLSLPIHAISPSSEPYIVLAPSFAPFCGTINGFTSRGLLAVSVSQIGPLFSRLSDAPDRILTAHLSFTLFAACGQHAFLASATSQYIDVGALLVKSCEAPTSRARRSRSPSHDASSRRSCGG
jgi:hypothetical protein